MDNRSLIAFFFILSCCFLFGCKSLPEERLEQAGIDANCRKTGDSLVFDLHNTLKVPIRMKVRSDDSTVQQLIDQDFPFILEPDADTFLFYLDSIPEAARCFMSFTYWPTVKVDSIKPVFTWPFPKGKKYTIIQGYNGSFSHNHVGSRYALDFDLSVGDTICSAGDGYVIGMIEGYKYGGSNRKWRPYANTITIYHPDQGALTQYAHLIENGAFVEVGDSVRTGQAIGLSGKTGFTSTPHLHFNVFRPKGEKLISYPCSFKGGKHKDW